MVVGSGRYATSTPVSSDRTRSDQRSHDPANHGTEPLQKTETDHCCQQYAHLSGLTTEEVQRVGSCGCTQAKRELAMWRDALPVELVNTVQSSIISGHKPTSEDIRRMLDAYYASK